MIFTVPSYTKAPRLDCRETQSDGFTKGGGVDVWNTILVADSTIREV